jgi:hypothetical protein
MSGVGGYVDTSEDVFQLREILGVGAGFVVEDSIHELSDVLNNLPTVAARATAPTQQGIREVVLQRHTCIMRKSCSDNEDRFFLRPWHVLLSSGEIQPLLADVPKPGTFSASISKAAIGL